MRRQKKQIKKTVGVKVRSTDIFSTLRLRSGESDEYHSYVRKSTIAGKYHRTGDVGESRANA